MECTEHGKKKRKKSNDVVSWAASVPPLLYGPPEANKWAPLINVPQLFLLCHQHWMMTLIFGFSPVPCCGVAVGPPAQKPMTNSNHGPSKKPWSSAYYFSFLYQRTAAGHKKARDKQEHKDGRSRRRCGRTDGRGFFIRPFTRISRSSLHRSLTYFYSTLLLYICVLATEKFIIVLGHSDVL